MMLLWIPILILIYLAASGRFSADGVAPGCCGVHATPGSMPTTAGPDPIDIARRRLARGEIGVAEYEEIRRTIG